MEPETPIASRATAFVFRHDPAVDPRDLANWLNDALFENDAAARDLIWRYVYGMDREPQEPADQRAESDPPPVPVA
jgi:hypothetical protein